MKKKLSKYDDVTVSCGDVFARLNQVAPSNDSEPQYNLTLVTPACIYEGVPQPSQTIYLSNNEIRKLFTMLSPYIEPY